MTMKVLLVDDHPLILAALGHVIAGLGDSVRVDAAASAAEARAALARDSGYDLVLLDLQLDDADGFDVLAEMRATFPHLPVVVVSASERPADVIRAVDLGAMGFVPKRSSNTTLTEALRLVLDGAIYVPPVALDAMAARAVASQPAARPAPVAPAAPDAAPSLEAIGLTPRQRDVLALLLQGKPNKLIARELGVSVETVKDHVAAVLRALGVGSRTQAVLAVSRMQQEPGRAFQVWKPAAP